ncbi:hypothetical protein Plhal304r1_c008g0031791 [Plasmopara halstedii]
MRLGFIFFVLVALHIASISATTQRTFKPILDSIPEDKVLETKKTGRVKAFAEILSKLRSSKSFISSPATGASRKEYFSKSFHSSTTATTPSLTRQFSDRYDSDFRHTSEVQKLLDSSKSAKKWSLGGLTARLKSMRFKLK